MSSIRKEVQDFVDLGPLPDESSPPQEVIGWQSRLERITSPVTDDEASLLLKSFGPDDCFGGAWALVHLIESAPSCPVREEPPESANEWIRLLWTRSRNALKR
jgi:hypothetical protein